MVQLDQGSVFLCSTMYSCGKACWCPPIVPSCTCKFEVPTALVMCQCMTTFWHAILQQICMTFARLLCTFILKLWEHNWARLSATYCFFVEIIFLVLWRRTGFLKMRARFKSYSKTRAPARWVGARERPRRARFLPFVCALTGILAPASGAGGSAWVHWRSKMTRQKKCRHM